MGETNGDVMGERAPSRTLASLFVAFLVVYYGIYFIFFTLRVSEYFRDVLRHFGFVRRFF